MDASTLAVRQLVDSSGNDFFRLGTVAMQVGDEIWVGGINGTLGLARFAR